MDQMAILPAAPPSRLGNEAVVTEDEPRGCLPRRRPPRPHLRRTQRTRERTDTGRPQRTPDAGHPDAQTPTPDSGHRSRGQTRVETGRPHRTLDAGSLAEDVDTPALGDHDSSAVGPAASARLPAALPGAARWLCRLSRASVHCCPQTNVGSSVESERRRFIRYGKRDEREQRLVCGRRGKGRK